MGRDDSESFVDLKETLHDLAKTGDAAELEALLSDLQETIRGERRALASTALQEARRGEEAALELLQHIERDLRNVTRLYKRLLDERNLLTARTAKLHKVIRYLEPSMTQDVHRDHGVELQQKGLVQYVSEESWRMDNRDDWGFEESTDLEGDCPIAQVARPHAWPKKRFTVVRGKSGRARDAS